MFIVLILSVRFLHLIEMDLLTDFLRVVKVLQWQEENAKKILSATFLLGLRHQSVNEQREVIFDFLKTLRLKSLCAVMKPCILNRNSSLARMISKLIETEIRDCNQAVKKYVDRCGE